MNCFRSNNDSLKYQRLTQSGCEDIAIWKSEFVAKTRFLCYLFAPIALVLISLLTTRRKGLFGYLLEIRYF